MKGRSVESNEQLQQAIRSTLDPLAGMAVGKRFAPLLRQIGNASIVMLGEATYGAHECQRTRAEITQLLIEEKGFNAVAVEADWADAHRAHRYVQHQSDDPNAEEALGNFQHFPHWIWRNQDVAGFIEWLHEMNHRRVADARIGFYGLDLYSYSRPIQTVIHHLEKMDQEAAQKARYRYSCFEQFDQDPQQCGYDLGYGLSKHREEEAIAQLLLSNKQTFNQLRQGGFLVPNDLFFAEQIERLFHNSESYYRELVLGRNHCWNLRNRHLFDSLLMLLNHLSRQISEPKIVVWTHNSHLGDARFTEMSTRGEISLGQLVRETYGSKACAIGFTTYSGTIAAASEWGGDMEQKQLRPALPESYEALFYSLEEEAFSLNLHDPAVREDLRKARLERAIGAIYRPQTERISHYFYTQLSQQFDLVLHFDRTDAVIPLDQKNGLI
jgi:erythromycin esterase-like protein